MLTAERMRNNQLELASQQMPDDNTTMNYYRFAQCPAAESCLGLKTDSVDPANGTHPEGCNETNGHQQLCRQDYSSDKISRCRMCATCIDGYQHLFGSPDCSPCPGGTKMSVGCYNLGYF